MTTTAQAVRVPRVGWLSLATMLVEYLVLSQSYDIHVLAEHDRPWAWLGGAGDGAAMLFIAIAVAVALSQRTRDLLAAHFAPVAARPRELHWVEFALGFGAYGGVLLLSSGVLTFTPPSTALFLGWLATLIVWVFCRTHWAWPAGGARAVLRSWQVWGPIVAIALLSAAAGLGARALWSTQSETVLRWVVRLLEWMGEAPELGPGQEIWLDDFGVEVAPVCSGYEGIGLMVAFLGGYLVVMRKHLNAARAWPLLPLAVAVVWLANVGRLAVLTWIGAKVSPEWAAGAFHSKAGWLLFCVVALSMVWLVQRVASRETEPVSQREPGSSSAPASSRAASSSPARALTSELDGTDKPPDTQLGTATTYYLAPLVAMTATALLTGVLFEPLDRLYALKAIVGLVALVVVGYRFRELLGGISSYSVAVGVVTFVLWALLRVDPKAETVERFAAQFADLGAVERTAWLIFRVLGTAVTVPICEELAFRGFLMRRIMSRNFVAIDYRQVSWLALLLSSLLFAALHGSWLAGIVAGLLYALLLRLRAKLAEVTVAHMVTNLCLALEALATKPVPYWN